MYFIASRLEYVHLWCEKETFHPIRGSSPCPQVQATCHQALCQTVPAMNISCLITLRDPKPAYLSRFLSVFDANCQCEIKLTFRKVLITKGWCLTRWSRAQSSPSDVTRGNSDVGLSRHPLWFSADNRDDDQRLAGHSCISHAYYSSPIFVR